MAIPTMAPVPRPLCTDVGATVAVTDELAVELLIWAVTVAVAVAAMAAAEELASAGKASPGWSM